MRTVSLRVDLRWRERSCKHASLQTSPPLSLEVHPSSARYPEPVTSEETADHLRVDDCRSTTADSTRLADLSIVTRRCGAHAALRRNTRRRKSLKDEQARARSADSSSDALWRGSEPDSHTHTARAHVDE